MKQEILYQESIAIKKMPININQIDRGLFEHELKRTIPATKLHHLKNATVNPDGVVIHKHKILPEIFPSPNFVYSRIGFRIWLRLLVRNFLVYRSHEKIERDVFWITDIWSRGYFHWILDALPRLFTIKDQLRNATLLLPGEYEEYEFIVSSLKPFSIQDVKFVQGKYRCKNLFMPTHTAPTGNFNEKMIRGLRSLFTDYFQYSNNDHPNDKVYISRGKARRRKIANENELNEVLEEYGFETINFEDYSFEQQVKIARGTRYLISNHGAGLSNMLFMRSGSSLLELRHIADKLNNCFFALASALNIKYFYQLCQSVSPDEDAHTANLIVDCQLLRNNIEEMLIS